MSKQKISVIIPIYNVEKYLSRCVDSVLSQTLTDIEIILVDDGSPDGCGKICDEYKEKDGRIKVVHKKNGGLSSARNAGLDVSEGEYTFFLDSDDWLEEDGLRKLYDKATETGVDFVRFRPYKANWPNLPELAPYTDGAPCELRPGFYNRADIEREVLARVLTTNSMTLGPTVSACMALYKSQFLRDNELRFDEEVKNSEDVIFSTQVAYCANSFYYIEEAGVYCYFYNEASISKGFKPDRFEKLKNLSYACEKLFGGKDNGFYDKQLAILRWYIVLNCISERDKLMTFKEKRRHCLNIVKDPFAKKIKLKLSELNVPLKMKLLMICAKLRLATVIALV